MLALDEGEPNTFQEVLESEDRENWIEATKKEIENLYENDTFEFVEKKNQSIVSSKWVYKLKKKPNGEIDKYKARLVARGFSQTQGVDFYETFARLSDTFVHLPAILVIESTTWTSTERSSMVI